MKKSVGDKAFQVFNIIVMLLIAAAIILPFMHVFSISVSGKEAVTTFKVGIWPIGFNFAAYKEVLADPVFLRSLINTVFLTIVITAFAAFINTLAAYVLSKEYFYGKKFITYFYVLTMYFSGGLIPTYLLVSKYLKLNNNFLAYILPSLVSVFYIIVIKSQIEAVPRSLTEAAYIDGANEYQVIFRLIIPIIIPTIAAICMFIALGTWNTWYSVLLYAKDNKLWTLQYYLRVMVFEKVLISQKDLQAMVGTGLEDISSKNYQMAAIILVAAPIVCIYPFIQKYFVKGILAGSVKG